MKQRKLIHIYLLGSSSVKHEDKTYRLKRKSLGIFVYLVVQNRIINRRELVSLFWPNVEAVKGLQSLSALLYRYPDPVKKCLDIQDQSIKFKSEHVWLDLSQFQENINFANQVWQNEKALKKTVRNLLEQSVALYRGAFIEDFYLKDHEEFMGWLVKERELFKHQAVDTLTRLLRHAYQHTNIEESIRFLNELLRIDPLNEDAHMAMIKLLVDDGQKDQAILHFQTFQEKLSKELNATPGRPITTYYQELYNPVLVPIERRVTEADFKLLHNKPAQIERQKNIQNDHPFTPPTSLPSVVVKLFGRERLIAQLEKEIVSADNRLISFTGMGGIGKTQLALAIGNQIASEFKDGVVYIPLRKVDIDLENDEADGLTQQISDQLATKTLISLGVPSNGDIPPFFQLIEALGRKELLLIYDNFEHLIEGADFFTTLLHAAAEVTILVTSRVQLNQPGERVIVVPYLLTTVEESVAPQIELGSDVQLFIDRAKRLNSQFEFDDVDIAAIQTICTLTGGLPLAIEQAASWVVHYSLAEIGEEVHRSYTFLENPYVPLDDPHRSIKSTLESSYQLLTNEEQHMLLSLSLFNNEFSRKAALAVSNGYRSTLISLTDRTLIQQVEPGWYSFHPLVAQMIQDQRNKDDQFDINAAHKRFAAYFLGVLSDWGKHDTLSKSLNSNFLNWINRIEDDIFQAWKWGVTDRSYDLLVNGIKALRSFFFVIPQPSRATPLLHWSLTQLSNQVPDHLKQVSLAPPHYTNLLTRVMLNYATNLTFDRNYPAAEKIYSQILVYLEGADFYYTHASVAIELARIYSFQNDKEQLFAKMQQIAEEKIKHITDPIELADTKYVFTRFYYKENDDEKIANQSLLAINHLDDSYTPVTAICYTYVAKIRTRQKRYAEAIQLIDNYVDVEANTRLWSRNAGKVVKGKLLLILNRPFETLEILNKIEAQVRLINYFFQVIDFYQIKILAKLELNCSGDSDAEEFVDFVFDAKRFIHWVDLHETPDKAYHAWIIASGYAALAAGQYNKGQMGLAQQASLQLKTNLSLVQALSIKHLEHLHYTLILIIHSYLQLDRNGLTSLWLSYLDQEKDSLSPEIAQAFNRLVQVYESRTGEVFEPLPAEQLPQTNEEILQLLIEESAYDSRLTDLLDDDFDNTKIEA